MLLPFVFLTVGAEMELAVQLIVFGTLMGLVFAFISLASPSSSG